MNRPNLLIMMVDQFQAALLDHGAPVRLPALQRLASVSTRFTHAFTPAPICTPARASFQLGQPVHEHGVIGNDRNMPQGPTLADHLVAAGYTTSYVGKWHLDPPDATRHDPGRRGWQRFVDAAKLRHPDVDRGNSVMASAQAPHEGVAPYEVEDHIDGRIAAEGRHELDRLHAQSNPFALMVSFHGPHAPYFIPRQWHDRFNPDSLPLPDTFDAPYTGRPMVQQTFRCRAWGQTWSPEKWRRVRAAYYGYAAMIDHLINGLLDKINLTNTAVLFLADHGENNGHLRMIYKGPMMDDTLVRIPALLHQPAQTQACDDSRLIDLTDLGASLLSLASAPRPGYQGHDTANLAWGGRPWVISEFYEANWVNPPLKQPVAMIRDGRWKLVATQGARPVLYDITDPLQDVHDRIEDPAAVGHAQRLMGILAEKLPWVVSTSHSSHGL